MSLLDALLLEPYRDPREIWIALRTDGATGAGTLRDPYNGSTVQAAGQTVSTLVSTANEATVTMSAPHGYIDGEVVTISGVTGTGASQWNGTFPVQVPPGSTTTFKYLMNATPAAPASGTILAAKNIYRFDNVMRALGDGVCVHIGPGVFETRGFDVGRNQALNWTIRPGQHI